MRNTENIMCSPIQNNFKDLFLAGNDDGKAARSVLF